MPDFGLTVKHDNDGKRIEMQCEHQNGLVYVVRGEANWVCDEDLPACPLTRRLLP